MMNKRKEIFMGTRIKIICASIILCMMFGSTASAMVAADLNYGGVSLHAGAEEIRTPPLSQAVNIIRGNFELKKSALVNSDITFKPEEFEKILGKKKIRYITVMNLPDARHGVLTLGGADILAGQTVARENIKYIRLVPFPDRAGVIQFYFKDAESPDDSAILCSVSVLEALNFAPAANNINISTQKNIPVFKAMKGSDPDGDALNYKILEAPKKGLLEILGDGSFIYRPGENYTGNDKFIYQVQDEHGNWSNPAAVNIKVTKAAANIRFTDMDGHWAANSAVKGVAYKFIDINPDFKFKPSELTTRAEFVQMAMRAAKLDKNLPEIMQTGFADDDDIAGKYKSYVKKAHEIGIINGIELDTGVYFDPNSIITRAEAAVILNNILKVPALSAATSKPVFADAVYIPSWAEKDVAALNSIGILNGDQNGNFNPYGLLDRAQSTEMLCNMVDYTENIRKSRSWWSSLFG
jgi:hypothetical protein